MLIMNPINPMKLLQIRASWEQFKARHPKFPSFLNAVSKGAVTEGTLIEMTITTADGKQYSSNLKLTSEDMQLVNDVKEMFSGQQGN